MILCETFAWHSGALAQVLPAQKLSQRTFNGLYKCLNGERNGNSYIVMSFPIVLKKRSETRFVNGKNRRVDEVFIAEGGQPYIKPVKRWSASLQEAGVRSLPTYS